MSCKNGAWRVLKVVRDASDIVAIPREEGAGPRGALACLAMNDNWNLWNFIQVEAQAHVCEIAGIPDMGSGEFRSLPDIHHEGVSIFSKKCWHGWKIHCVEFSHDIRRSISDGGGRKKADDMVESDSHELAKEVLRGGCIFREDDNFLLG